MELFRAYLDLVATDPATQKGKKLPERDIKAFEQEIGFTLPADYRNLLLRFGAGSFCFGRFRPAASKLTPPFDLSHEWIDAGKAYVFAEDYGGNLYMFDYRVPSDNPQVLFLDHEMDDEAEPQVIYDSFADFVADHYGVDGQGRPSLNRQEFALRVEGIARLKPGDWVKIRELSNWSLALKVLPAQIIPDPDAPPAHRPAAPDAARTFCFAIYDPNNPTAFAIDPFGRHGKSQLQLDLLNSKIYRDKSDSIDSVFPCAISGTIERKIHPPDESLALPVFFLIGDTPIPANAELELRFKISER